MSPAASALPTSSTGRQRLWLNPWLPALAGVLCFLNSLANDFTYDDRPLILKNPRIRTLSDFRAVWLTDWWRDLGDEPELARHRDRLYRPLTLFSFALNYAACGYNPVCDHLANVVLHGVACFLLWHFARRLTGDAAIASVGAILFAVHPVHAEAVADIVGRAEVLAAVFLLLGLLILQLRGRRAGLRALCAAAAFLAALFAKETAVCYPAVALLVLCASHGDRSRTVSWWLLHAAVLALPLVVYVPLRLVALEGTLFRSQPADVLMNPLVTASLGERVLGVFTVLGQYARLLVVPSDLCCDYGVAIIDPQRSATLMTALGVLVAGGALVGLIGLMRPGSAWRRVALLVALILASYALISNTVILIGVSLAERLLYWPSAPAMILVAVGVVAFWNWQCAPGRPLVHRARLFYALGALIVFTLGLRTVVRNADWAGNLTLFTADVAAHPEGALLNRHCAIELLDFWRGTHGPKGQAAVRSVVERHLARLGLWRADWPPEKKAAAVLEGARRHLDTALRIHPAYDEALTLRARVRAQQGDRTGAERDLQGALLINPHNRDARGVLARLIYGDGEAEQQLAALETAVEHSPNDPAHRVALGRALLDRGRYGDAQVQLERACDLAPEDVEALRLLADVLALQEENPAAIATYRRILELDPDNWQAHANLVTLLQRDDADAALHHAQRAYELQPADLRTQMNLAGACERVGQTQRALDLYCHILKNLDATDRFRPVLEERIRRLTDR